MVWPFDFAASVCIYRIGSLGLQATASDFKIGCVDSDTGGEWDYYDDLKTFLRHEDLVCSHSLQPLSYLGATRLLESNHPQCVLITAVPVNGTC